MRENKIDMDLFIECFKRAGGTVVKSKNGHGGIYLRGKELTMDEIRDILMNGPDYVKEIKQMTETQNMIIIGTVEQINAVLKCINPSFPIQDLSTLEKNGCFYTMNGVGVEIILKK